MASSISSVALVPISAVAPRPAALEPVGTGAAAAFAPEALRQSQAQAETFERTRNRESERFGTEPERRQTFGGNNAPFTAQLLNQGQDAPKPPSFADATRAYSRFREEPQTGFILDQPARIDVKV